MLLHDIQGDPSTLPSTGVRRTKEARPFSKQPRSVREGKGQGTLTPPGYGTHFRSWGSRSQKVTVLRG